MTATALAVASALAALVAALLFALRARYFERVLEATELALRNIGRRCRDAERSLARQLAEINQAKLALAAAEKEIDLLSTERDLLRAKLDALSLSRN